MMDSEKSHNRSVLDTTIFDGAMFLKAGLGGGVRPSCKHSACMIGLKTFRANYLLDAALNLMALCS